MAVRRSRFVDVIAWLTIALSVLCLPFVLLAILALPALMPAEAAAYSPPLAATGVLLIVQVVMGVGLVKRRNWARVLLIVGSAVLAVWQGVDLFAASDLGEILPSGMRDDASVAAALESVIVLVRVLGIAVIAGCVWVIYRFTRADMRAEFAGH